MGGLGRNFTCRAFRYKVDCTARARKLACGNPSVSAVVARSAQNRDVGRCLVFVRGVAHFGGMTIVGSAVCAAILIVMGNMADCVGLALHRIVRAVLGSGRLGFVERRLGQCASGAFHERRKRRAAFGDFLFELHDIGHGQHVLLGFAKKRQQRFAVGTDQVGELHFCVRGARRGQRGAWHAQRGLDELTIEFAGFRSRGEYGANIGCVENARKVVRLRVANARIARALDFA